MNNFKSEKEGQIDFFKKHGIRDLNDKTDDSVKLTNNTDGGNVDLYV